MRFLFFALALAVASPALLAQKPKARGPKPPKSALIDMAPIPDIVLPAGLITTELGGQDLDFLRGALDAKRLQIWLGSTAKERGTAEQVKALGDALGSARKEYDLIAGLAEKKGSKVAPGDLPAAGQAAVEKRLAPLTGPKFDKAVMEQIVEVNERSVDLYTAALNASDSDIKEFASQMLPIAKDHLRVASQIAGKSVESGPSKPAFRARSEGASPALAAPEAKPVSAPAVVEASAPKTAAPAPKASTEAPKTPGEQPSKTPAEAQPKASATPSATPAKAAK